MKGFEIINVGISQSYLTEVSVITLNAFFLVKSSNEALVWNGRACHTLTD